MKELIVISVFIFTLHNAFSSSCYWNNNNPYKLFSTKTPYIVGRSDIRDTSVLHGCKAVSIWGLFRHGQRYPGIKYSENIKNAIAIRDDIISKHKEGKGILCAQDVDNLRKWKVNKNMFKNLHDVTEDGLNETRGIAKRLKKGYSDLLRKLHKGTYTFRSSTKPYIQKCIDSFLEGLKQPKLKIEKSKERDIMSAFDDCKIYNKIVKQNSSTYAEANKYLTSNEYLKSLDRIQTRLGLDYNLTNDNVTGLYDLCRYVWSAVDNTPSPWCALFDEKDLKVQEYYQDLRLYYRNGYGNPWNIEFGQIPLADLLQTFRKEKVKPKKKITAYFTHATMLSMVYAALGQFKDEKPLTADERDDNRKWKTSEHALLAGNLIAVLNRCNTTVPDSYVVAFYMNEQPLHSICNYGVCSWKEFEELLRLTENKTYETVCNNRNYTQGF